MKTLRNTVITLLLAFNIGWGQTLVGIGYSTPPLMVAPGQVVPLLITGLKTVLPAGLVVQAQSLPLPSVMANISVTLVQTPQYSRALPIVAIQQSNQCTGPNNTPAADCILTAITVQIPFDISVPNPLIGAPIFQPVSSLEIYENGSISKSFSVLPVPDLIHVAQSCDINIETSANCYPIVTHADGSLVLQAPRSPGQPPLTNSEAHPGEEIVMYALGLGTVRPAVDTGAASPSPAAVVASPIYLQFDYHPNASPSPPILNSSLTNTSQPLFAGLTPGQVGLYQINFVVPSPPVGTQVCGAPVESNLTISITTADGRSFSGAAICVDFGSQ